MSVECRSYKEEIEELDGQLVPLFKNLSTVSFISIWLDIGIRREVLNLSNCFIVVVDIVPHNSEMMGKEIDPKTHETTIDALTVTVVLREQEHRFYALRQYAD